MVLETHCVSKISWPFSYRFPLVQQVQMTCLFAAGCSYICFSSLCSSFPPVCTSFWAHSRRCSSQARPAWEAALRAGGDRWVTSWRPGLYSQCWLHWESPVTSSVSVLSCASWDFLTPPPPPGDLLRVPWLRWSLRSTLTGLDPQFSWNTGR